MINKKSPEKYDGKCSNISRTKKLSSASQRTLNRKRSQQNLDSQLRDDGEETEEDLLLNDERCLRTKGNIQNNDSKNTSPIKSKRDNVNFSKNKCNIASRSNENFNNSTKHRKSKKNDKEEKPKIVVENEVPKEEIVNLSICHNPNTHNNETLQNCNNNGDGNDSQEQISSLHAVCHSGILDLNGTTNIEELHQDELQTGKQDHSKVRNCINSTSFNSHHQQPDIVSWFPLLSKTSAMQCKNDDNEIKPFRSNVEIPFVSSSLRNNVARNTFDLDDIASPKLAARHAMILEQAAAKQAAYSEKKRTPSFCFNVSSSDNSDDNECQNETPLL